jgi:hypothetical protein
VFAGANAVGVTQVSPARKSLRRNSSAITDFREGTRSSLGFGAGVSFPVFLLLAFDCYTGRLRLR